ncbi:hypothetical protein F5887DRAFT_940608 [Amanita rubescens]|nr:hypothetical protein F5887DRAFT_940608 [Amanita rubescens]
MGNYYYYYCYLRYIFQNNLGNLPKPKEKWTSLLQFQYYRQAQSSELPYNFVLMASTRLPWWLAFLDRLVKNLFRQQRPQHEGAHQKQTYGMPSTHSTTISYFATFIVLACLRLPIHPSLPSGTATRLVPPIMAVPWAILVVMSRVWLGHHTWPQVIVGVSYGVAFGSVWFSLWTDGLQQHGQKLEELVESLI